MHIYTYCDFPSIMNWCLFVIMPEDLDRLFYTLDKSTNSIEQNYIHHPFLIHLGPKSHPLYCPVT